MTSPRASFVVVTHARPERLPGAIESIRRQTIEDREIVLVVNGPDRETQKLLRAFGPEVRTIVLEDNKGVGAGRNVGIALARGEIVFFLDDDATLRDHDTAARALAHFEGQSDLGVVGLLVLDATTGVVEHGCIPLRDKRLPPKVTGACYYAGGACAIRRGVFDRVGLYDESLFYGGEELDLSYRLLEAGFTIVFDPTIAVMHHSTAERDRSAALYFDARNRPWVALRHLPLLCWTTHCFAWWCWSLARGFRMRAIGTTLCGIRDCVAGTPTRWEGRRPISRQTRRFIARHNGRLWY